MLAAGGAWADQLHVPAQYPTIQAAIDAAVDGDEVVIAPGVYRGQLDTPGKGITLRSTDPFDPDVVATTVLSGDTDLDGIGDTRILTAVSGETLATTLDGLTLTQGRADFGAAVFADQSSITLRRCQVIDNVSTLANTSQNSGAVATLSGAILAEDCVFDNNRCWRLGRDLYARSGAIVASGCDFRTTNPVPGGGSYAIRATVGGIVDIQNCTFVDLDGAILAQTVVECTIDYCVFDNNSTPLIEIDSPMIRINNSIVKNCGPEETEFSGDDRAIGLVSTGDILIDTCHFVDNTLDNFSGMLVSGGLGTVRNSVFARNTNSDTGLGSGGNFSSCGIVGGLEFVDCLFENNAARDVAALEVTAGTNTLRRCTFRGNTSQGYGALFVGGSALLQMEDCLFEYNSTFAGGSLPAVGGAITGDITSRGYVRRTDFVSNHADEGGGAIAIIRTRPFVIDACRFYGNSTGGSGGAVYQTSFRGLITDVSNSRFVDNIATVSGGAIFSGNRISVANNSFYRNTASLAPVHRQDANTATFVNNLIHAEDAVSPLDFAGAATNSVVSHNIIPGGYAGPGTSSAIIDITPALTSLPSDGGDGWGDDPATPDIDESLNDDFGDLTPLSVEAIDAGSNVAVPLDRFDFDNDGSITDQLSADALGNPRFVDIASVSDTGLGSVPIVDIGAIELPAKYCAPDINRDGVLSPDDFSAWIAAFNTMSPGCDQNADGSCTPADFSAWIANYNAGC